MGLGISIPIKNQILYFSIHSIKYTVLQYTCAKNRIKTVCKIYCNTVYLIRYNSILYTVVQNTVYLQYTFIIYIWKYSILTVSQFFIGLDIIILLNIILSISLRNASFLVIVDF